MVSSDCAHAHITPGAPLVCTFLAGAARRRIYIKQADSAKDSEASFRAMEVEAP